MEGYDLASLPDGQASTTDQRAYRLLQVHYYRGLVKDSNKYYCDYRKSQNHSYLSKATAHIDYVRELLMAAMNLDALDRLSIIELLVYHFSVGL